MAQVQGQNSITVTKDLEINLDLYANNVSSISENQPSQFLKWA